MTLEDGVVKGQVNFDTWVGIAVKTNSVCPYTMECSKFIIGIFRLRILKNWIENSKTIMNTFDLHLIYFCYAFILSEEHEFNLLQFSFHPI